MKKHYEKMCMTPLGFVSEGNLLAGSVVTNQSVINTNAQEVQTYDFSDSSFSSGNSWTEN